MEPREKPTIEVVPVQHKILIVHAAGQVLIASDVDAEVYAIQVAAKRDQGQYFLPVPLPDGKTLNIPIEKIGLITDADFQPNRIVQAAGPLPTKGKLN